MLLATKPTKKLDLPYEIKLKIAGIIKSQELISKRIFSEADFSRGHEKENANANLSQISLLNISWHSAVTEFIWVIFYLKLLTLKDQHCPDYGLNAIFYDGNFVFCFIRNFFGFTGNEK